jgi:mannose-6-phosphate isomerase-like protein (cupin superfamily)
MDNYPDVIRVSSESSKNDKYENHVLAEVNDHVVRISTMTEDYPWHSHPNSDETFLVIEGGLYIDFNERTIQLSPGEMTTVKRGVRHRTRPVGERSVNLTFELADAETLVQSPTPAASGLTTS